MTILVRSVVFNLLFYLNTLVYLIAALPTFFMPYRAIIAVAKSWGRTNLVLLRVVAGIDCEIRGREKIPKGPIIVAAKHQSAWETFALLPLIDNPVFILKRELQWIPIFGWLTIKGRMVPVDRGGGSHALAAMTERARIELADNRQLIIFPGGNSAAGRGRATLQSRRRASLCGRRRALRSDCAQLWTVLAAPVAKALSRHSGGRNSDPIPPGLGKEAFFERLQSDIESATVRLIAEGRAKMGR